MRVLILGPVVNENTSGGVAVFDEGLYSGFSELGDYVNIISIEKSSLINNIVVKTKNPNPNKILFKFNRIAKEIQKYKPDLVISSLHYSIGIKKYKKKWPSAKYVQILHGTPSPINGRLKAWAVNTVARYSKKHFDKLVTVSHLSWAIKKKINRVECDNIINTGTTLKPNINKYEKKYDFCYVGRLYRDKNIEKMMDALIELHKENNNLKVCIVGFGEQENFFQSGGKYDLDFVEFRGKLKHSEVSEVYAKSKFFISICELEACGLAFSEAAINGCNPIASLSSGQTSLFRGKDYYHEVDASSIDVLIEELNQVVKKYSEIKPSDIHELMEIFSYKNIAYKYKKLFF